MAWDYEKQKAHVAKVNRQQSVIARDIGPLPKVKNPKRRKACRSDFKLFCETYFPAVFNLKWSDDHLRVIKIIESAILRGGLFSVAMPRAEGKTSLCLAAAEWSLLYGHRKFPFLIGASEDAATDLLDHIKADFETNDLLNADFPEVCHPIRCLEGITRRSEGQLLNGAPTRIGWTAKEIILPTVPKSCASGSVVRVAGITGRIRGQQAQRPSDGATIRPDFVLIDDPQTDESAHSPQQVRKRLSTVCGAILGLAGPGKKIAGVMPVTVICKGDMADQVLDRKKHPEWQGERIKMMRSMPTNLKKWELYADVRAEGLRDGKGLQPATAFYLEHRTELDDGAEASWLARYNHDEASAIQHAMNLKLTDEASFMAEYQNDPLALELDTPLLLKADNVTDKIIGTDRGICPAYTTKLTAFIDVQGTVLYYVVCAWDQNFTGHIVDYGTYPEQQRSYFYLREVSPTLAMKKPGTSLEGYIYDGLECLTTKLLSRKWRTDTGTEVSISRCMIDANWGDSTTVVKQFCRESAFSTLLLPSHGRGITADRRAMNDYKSVPGERSGWNWRISLTPSIHCLYDTNSWKTFTAQRILMAKGEPGSLTLFNGSPTQHKMLAEHVVSEYPIPTEGSGRIVNVWRMRPNRENHYFDCLVGCCVGASEQGVLSLGHQPSAGAINRKRRKVQVQF